MPNARVGSVTWIGGIYGEVNGRRPYASGYPEPQDLYLAAILSLDPNTGEILTGDDGFPQVLDSGLLMRWEEIEYLEFTVAPVEED